MSLNNASEDYLCPNIGVVLDVRICTGKSCRKRKGANKKLHKRLGGACETNGVKCQNICKGPVVLVHRDGERFWFRRIQGKKTHQAFLAFLDTGRLSKRLRSHLKKHR